MPSAEELRDRGVEEINAGRHARASATLRRAQTLAEDPDLLARIEATWAYLEAETGNPVGARARCDHALTQSGLSSQTRGLLQGQRGLLLMLSGDLAGALADLGSAISAGAGDDVVGRGLLNRGDLYLQQQDAVRAAADFAGAATALHRAGLPVEAAKARHNLGYSRFLTGDLPQALQDMAAAHPVLAPLSPVHEATCDQDRAEVLMAAGMTAEGRSALAAAARAYGSRRLRRRQAEAELALARNLLLDDPAACRRTARQAARHFELAGAVAWCERATALLVSAEIELGGRASSLVSRADEAAAALRAQGLAWADTSLGLHAVRVLLRRGESAEVARRLVSLRPGAAAPMDVRLLAREVRCEAALLEGRRADALAHLRRGLEQVHEWQSSFGSLDLQTLVAGRGHRLGVRGLAIAAESGRDDLLLEWSERARMLASRVQPVRAPRDVALAGDLSELREIAEHQVSGAGAGTDREATLRRRVRERAWQTRGSGEVADPCTLADLQRGLAERPRPTALLSYVVTADRVVALVVTPGGTRRRDLGARGALDELLGGLVPDLDMAAARLPASMAAAVRGELADRVARIDRLLVAPLGDLLGDALDGHRVVLTPSSVLAGLPWTLLPSLVGRPLVLAQSATSWLARARTPLRMASAGFVAGPRVVRAEAEVTATSRGWRGAARCLVGADATAAAVSSLAASVDVLHVAAHGRHSAENPMFSGFQLADGPWFGYDIDRLPRVPDVVLLSACEVGRSSVRAGEELIGMTAAWLHAGARCVVAAPAAVNDEAAYDVLTRVHARLAAGDDPPAAVADAVGAVRADAPPAPFVCFG